MSLVFDHDKVEYLCLRNEAISYGLTLVVGLPFPQSVCQSIKRVQSQLESFAPGRFVWYLPEHCHATLIAPVLGRYRKVPPLQRRELPQDIDSFAGHLAEFFSNKQPFLLEFATVDVTEEGVVVISENTMAQQLTTLLHSYPELDQPKPRDGLHIAIGYLNSPRPFASVDEHDRFVAALVETSQHFVVSTMIHEVSLVHYANRTLNRIVGRIVFTLGSSMRLSGQELLKELNVG